MAKLRLIRALLKQYDLVVWIDADAIFVDPTVDISRELVPGRWLYAVEHDTVEGRHLNTGVLMMRSCPEAELFLADVAAQRQFFLHKWWEQAAMLYLLGYDLWSVQHVRSTKYSAGLLVLDKRWNSIPPDPAPAPYIFHGAGLNHRQRMETMQERLAVFRRTYPDSSDRFEGAQREGT